MVSRCFARSLGPDNVIGDLELNHNGDLIIRFVNRKVLLTDTGFSGRCEFDMPQQDFSPVFSRNLLAFCQHVCVALPEAELPAITALEVAAEDFGISFQSQPGVRYSLRAGGDFGGWRTILEGLEGDGGIKQFTDADAIRGGRRFYQIVSEFIDAP